MRPVSNKNPRSFAGVGLLQFLDELNSFAGFGGGGEDGLFVGLHDSQPMGEILCVVGPWF